MPTLRVVVTTLTVSGRSNDAVTVVAAVSYDAVQTAPDGTVAVAVHASVESVQLT
jgi:hypothetical protein